MHDRVEAVAGLRVAEDELAETRAVDAAVPHELLTELAHDGVESRCPRLVGRMCCVVRVDDLSPQVVQHGRHRRLA